MRIQVLVVEGARPKSVLSGGEKYRSTLIGCKCGIAPNFLIICYYNKMRRQAPELGPMRYAHAGPARDRIKCVQRAS